MKKLIISVSLILTLSFITGCGCTKEKIKKNTNENVVKDQTVEAFTFTNTSLEYKNGTSILKTKVTNTSNETQYLKEFKIIVKDKNGMEIITMIGFVGSSIDAKQSKTINSSYGEDLSGAFSIEYEIIK